MNAKWLFLWCNQADILGPVVSCRILPYPAVSCRICRILPYPAVPCRILRILPYPAVWQGHLDEPRWRHVAQNEEDENQDSDTSSVIDENPLAQPETLFQPQPLTQPQTFSARAPRTQDLPPDHAEEETVEAYLERLLGSAPRRNSLPRRPGDTPSEDADFAEAQTANLLDDL